MPVLAATNIRHAFGDRVILDGCSISIEPGERVGVVGRNGSGKTTLLKVLAGRLTPDSGLVSLQRGSRVGYLSQDPTLDPDETLRDAAEGAFDELHRLHGEQHELYERMAGVGGDALDRLMKQQAELERRIEAAGGYAIDHKIDAVLHGLGFTDAQFTIKTRDLSGGQRGRLALARLLLEQPDVLLLDEPTNHLDIDGREWLESFLIRDYRGAVLMISHDRSMLDTVVTRIVETEQGRLIDYPGNYAAFRELRAERRTSMLRAYENQQTKFRQEEAFIRRYKAGQRAKQARGRETRLDREKRDGTLERPTELGSLRFEFPGAERTGDIVISARGLAKSYAQRNPEGGEATKVLFHGLDVSIARGERWGIIGPNGAGKTTLVRCLVKSVDPTSPPADDPGWTPDAGVVRLGSNVKAGFYRQSHEHLDHDATVWRHIQSTVAKETAGTGGAGAGGGKLFSEQQSRNLAGVFLFSGDEQERTLGSLSGGERSRAVLAGLLASAKNLLVLDEPTNHLDIPSCERLEEALTPDEDGDGYDGALLLISHDRALIDATCEHLIVLDGRGGAEIFHGSYSMWRDKRKQREAEARRAEEEAKRRREAEERRRTAQAAPQASGRSPASPMSKLKTEQLEQKIEKIETRIRAIDAAFNDPEVWKDPAACSRLGDERKRLAEDLEPLEFEWMQRAEHG
ncbi:MAG: ABC-F family ATP-binding cassette domain-containing protein [Phycisphaerales bacterium]